MPLTTLHAWKAQSIAKYTLIVHCEFTEYNFANLILEQMSNTYYSTLHTKNTLNN